MKVLTVVGTRPELIRLSSVIRRLDDLTDHTLVFTGQNWDDRLSTVFFRELGIRDPDRDLRINTSSLGHSIADVIVGVEEVLDDCEPDAFLVLGDTNSSLGSIMAKRRGVPIFHMEAGNRCYDENVPEEINRRIVDHTADFNLCYTEHARRNLLAEGLHPRRIFVTGSPLFEVIEAHRTQIDQSSVLADHRLTPGSYVLASLHREENVDNVDHLAALFEALSSVGDTFGARVLVSAHPRLRDRLTRSGLHDAASSIELCQPFGYFDYMHLQQHARCVLSDSGTISEEAAMLGFPAVTVRNAMERPEALDTGSVVISGLDPSAVVAAARLVVSEWESGVRPTAPSDYRCADSSSRVVRLITGLAPLHRRWANLDSRSSRLR